MNILKQLSLSEVPELQVGDTILTIWNGGNLGGRKWCEREPLQVIGLPDNIQTFWIELKNDVRLSPKADLEFIGKNENGLNYWIVKIEEEVA